MYIKDDAIVICKLMFLHKFITLPSNSVSQLIFLRKLFLYLSGTFNFKRGFISDICRFLCLYNLEFILDNCSNIRLIRSTFTWERIVKTAVLGKSSQLWLTRLIEDDSFERFRKLHMSISPAVVWRTCSNRAQLILCDYIARLWATLPDKINRVCPYCETIYGDCFTRSCCGVQMQLGYKARSSDIC